MRQFETGATRDSDSGKPDFRGFLSIPVIRLFGRYMHKHRQQADGQMRASDNWKKGIPQTAYIESGWRHWLDLVQEWEKGNGLTPELEEAIGAMMFNVMGLAHELMNEERLDKCLDD